jgi:hypothetical protein
MELEDEVGSSSIIYDNSKCKNKFAGNAFDL